MADTLLGILEKTTDARECMAAQKQLEQAAQANLPNFLVELSRVLADPKNNEIARYQAALQVKNHLTSNNASVKVQYQHRWLQIDNNLRMEIKKNSFNALGSEARRPSSIPQVIAAIGSAELPTGQWSELIQALVQNVNNGGQGFERTKEASLETIGYICCDVKPELLAAQSNLILNAICAGLLDTEESPYVRLAAITAMLNSLEFTKENFDRENERNHIMQVICQNTLKNERNGYSDVSIRTRALECLVKIVTLYYQYMPNYMTDIFQLTIKSMEDDEQICLQGIEFWSTVCDEEMDLAIEAAESQEMGKEVEHHSANYARGALPYITPKLTQLLTQQQDDDGGDSEEWSPAKAAGVCLMNLATCCENDILNHVMEFIANNIESKQWQQREAAVMAFGSILEGPSPDNLKPCIDQALPIIIKRLRDESVSVRDTAAWFVGRACDIVPESALNPDYFQVLLEAMVNGLADQPRVAQNICWAFTSLSDAAYDAAVSMLADEGDTPKTYIMSQFYTTIVQKLLEATNRADGNQNNLRGAAYEAVMEMIKNSPEDCYQTVLNTTHEIMGRIEKLFAMESSLDSSMRSQYHDMQSLLCATLQSVIRKVKPEHMNELSNKCMESLLKMLGSSHGVGSVQEDALQAVGTLIEVVGNDFEKYMPHFQPFLCQGLENHQEASVCIAAVGVVTDICRAMQKNFGKYFEVFMNLMYRALTNQNVHYNVKPQIVAAMGDAALALGPDFKRYLEPVLMALQQASNFQVNPNDYEMLEYQSDLREACLDAFTGIIQGLKGDDTADENQNRDVLALEPHLEFIFKFLCQIAADKEELNETLLSSSVGLIGDISMAFGPLMDTKLLMKAFQTDGIQYLLATGAKSKVDKTKRLSNWAIKHIKKIDRGNF